MDVKNRKTTAAKLVDPSASRRNASFTISRAKAARYATANAAAARRIRAKERRATSTPAVANLMTNPAGVYPDVRNATLAHSSIAIFVRGSNQKPRPSARGMA